MNATSLSRRGGSTIAAMRALALCLAVAACDQSVRRIEPESEPISVTLTERFTLDSSADRSIGSLTDVRRWRDGYVAASSSSRNLVLFGFDGSIRQLLGRRGRGPGEFSELGPSDLIDSTTLLVMDNGTQRFSEWDLAAGKLIREYPSPVLALELLVDGDVVYAGSTTPVDLSSVSVIGLNDGRERHRGVQSPQPFQENRHFAGSMPHVWLAEWRDSILVGWSIGDSLRLTSRDLEGGRWIPVPRVHRRGMPARFVEEGENPIDPGVVLGRSSRLIWIATIPDGRIVLSHVDAVFGPAGSGQAASHRRWLTVLDSAARPLCVDRMIHDMTYDLTQVFLIGDELMMSRTSADDGTTRFYAVELDSECGGP